MKCVLLSVNNIDEDYAFNRLKEYIEPNMKVLCIPFASDLNWLIDNEKSELEKYGRFWTSHYKPFSKYGITEDNFYVAKIHDNEYELKKIISESDIIYFSGGQMEKLIRLLYHYNLIDYLLIHMNEKIFIGESAGALVLQDEYTEVPHIDECYNRYRREKGIGIINNMNIIVHYDEQNRKHRRNFRLLKWFGRRGKNVVCLSNDGAVLITDNNIEYLGKVYK